MRQVNVAFVALLLASVASAAEPRVTGTYSSLRFGTEDLTGMEVSVLYGGHAYYVLVQCAEGEPGVPALVPARVDGLALSFQLSESSRSGCPTTPFRGTIGSKGLSGRFGGMAWPGFLKRGPSYWQ